MEFSAESAGRAVACPNCHRIVELAPEKPARPRRAPNPFLQRLFAHATLATWVLALLLLISLAGNIFQFTHHRASIASNEAEKKESRAEHQAEINARLARADQDIRDSVAGIYGLDNPRSNDRRKMMDLRSDGTAQRGRHPDLSSGART